MSKLWDKAEIFLKSKVIILHDGDLRSYIDREQYEADIMVFQSIQITKRYNFPEFKRLDNKPYYEIKVDLDFSNIDAISTYYAKEIEINTE
jgi:hypothetical protein